MDATFSGKILAGLLFDADYANKVVPFLKEEYFDGEEKWIAKAILNLRNKYTSTTQDQVWITLKDTKGISDKALANTKELLYSYKYEEGLDPKWMLDETEKYCRDKALFLAILDGAKTISDNGDTNKIYKDVESALSISFETTVGHEYLEDIEKRYELYHLKEDKVSWGVSTLDEITGGGMSKKNLICAVAPTGVGKSAFMCAIASNAIKNGQNVLYISMEMSEQRVAERIDANLFRRPIRDIRRMSKEEYLALCKRSSSNKRLGRLFIKEYPTSGANVNHFKALIHDLKVKKGFVPDLVVVDYMNICSSARVRSGDMGSYGYIKSISEELRGLAVENNVVLLTATQTNRNGFDNSSVTLKDVSESIGSIFVMDMAFALIRTEALDQENQIKILQLKNRYSDPSQNQEIFLCFDREQMRIFDRDSKENVNNPGNWNTTSYRPPVKETLLEEPMPWGGNNSDEPIEDEKPKRGRKKTTDSILGGSKKKDRFADFKF